MILPPRQSDQAIASLPLARFESFQGSKNADKENLERCQQALIFGDLIVEYHIVDNQVVSLRRHGRNSVSHAPEHAPRNWPGSDGDGWLAVLLDGLENDPVGMAKVCLRQHIEKRIHLHVQEWIGRHRLEGLRDGPFAGAADAVEDDDAS